MMQKGSPSDSQIARFPSRINITPATGDPGCKIISLGLYVLAKRLIITSLMNSLSSSPKNNLN